MRRTYLFAPPQYAIDDEGTISVIGPDYARETGRGLTFAAARRRAVGAPGYLESVAWWIEPDAEERRLTGPERDALEQAFIDAANDR